MSGRTCRQNRAQRILGTAVVLLATGAIPACGGDNTGANATGDVGGASAGAGGGDRMSIGGRAQAGTGNKASGGAAGDSTPGGAPSTTSGGGKQGMGGGGGRSIREGNLITNGDFEDGTTGWRAMGAGTLAITQDGAHSGSSLVYQGRTETWNGPKVSLTDLVAVGDSITVTGWVRTSAPKTSVYVTLVSGDEDAQTESSFTRVATATATDSSWTKISGELKIPDVAGATTIDLYFEGPAAGVVLYLDDVVVEFTRPVVSGTGGAGGAGGTPPPAGAAGTSPMGGAGGDVPVAGAGGIVPGSGGASAAGMGSISPAAGSGGDISTQARAGGAGVPRGAAGAAGAAG